MPHPDLGTKTDINGEEFEYCTVHSSAAKNRLEGFAWCEAGDNPDCHPDRESCPVLVQHLQDIMEDFEQSRNYSLMIFPARLKDGVIVSPASPDHPDPTGLVDVRTYFQHYENDVPVGPIEPMSENQNADGSYRFECTQCIRGECKLCSWNRHCVCDVAPNCEPYTAEELAEFEDEEDEWDKPPGLEPM